ncbi:MAG TPA: hypothetical protein VFK66_02570 [Oryzihumus sp.]|nr:hypothetical protein [Oryzihumus sp.]
MEMNEAFRRIVVGHRWMLLLFAVAPLLVVAVLTASAHPAYVASARIQQSSAKVGSDTEADSVVNQVRGIATSTTAINQALQAAGVNDRRASDVAGEVTVTQFGASPVLDLSVTDSRPEVATRVATALARTVIDYLGGEQQRRVQAQISQMQGQQRQLYTQRQSVVDRLSATTDRAQTATLSATLTTLDQELSDLSSTIRQLQLPDATAGSAMLISPAVKAQQVSRRRVTDLTLALLAGLVAGLLVASVVEVLRPRVADPGSFARELGVPMLGQLTLPRRRGRRRRARQRGAGGHRGKVAAAGAAHEADPPATVPLETALVLRRAASREHAHTIVVVEAGELDQVEAAAAGLQDALAAPQAAPSSNGWAEPDLHQARAGAERHDFRGQPAPGTEAGTATTTRLRGQQAELSSGGVQVVRLSDVRALTNDPGHVLLVLDANLTAYAEVRRVTDICAATGWPVIGVLGLRYHKGARR